MADKERTPYYKALEVADEAWRSGKIDLTDMKALMAAMRARQLHALYQQSEAGGE